MSAVHPSTHHRAFVQILTGHSIVFSLWTKTLDGIENALASRGMSCMRLDGSLTGVARAAVIQAFHNDSAVKTLLMTTGVGATG